MLGLMVEKQKAPPPVYEEVKLDAGYRIDLLVKNKLVVDIKSVEALNDSHLAQIPN
jgi:GxxExxY protein